VVREVQASCPHVYLGLDSFSRKATKRERSCVVLSTGREWESGAAKRGYRESLNVRQEL
jgi:hypothetical protein